MCLLYLISHVPYTLLECTFVTQWVFQTLIIDIFGICGPGQHMGIIFVMEQKAAPFLLNPIFLDIRGIVRTTNWAIAINQINESCCEKLADIIYNTV